MTRRILLTAALLLSLPAAAQPLPPEFARIAGTYAGDVFNGDDLDPITTTFSVTGGRLAGEYSVGAEQGDYHGVISGIVFEDPYTITGEWTDQFGEGFLQLQFSRDFGSFTGYWSDYDTDNQLPWDGVRQ